MSSTKTRSLTVAAFLSLGIATGAAAAGTDAGGGVTAKAAADTATPHSLSATWLSMLAYNPVLQSSVVDEKVAGARVIQARSSLRPQLQFSAGAQAHRRHYNSYSRFGKRVDRDSFDSSNAQVELTVPLYQPQARVEWEKSLKQVDASKAETAIQRQEESVRLVTLWLEMLQAGDEMRLAQRDIELHSRLLQAQNRALEAGLGSMPELSRIAAQLASSQTEMSAAQSRMLDSEAQIKTMSGVIDRSFPARAEGLTAEAVSRLITDTELATHIAEIEGNSVQVQAKKKALRVAEAAVRKTKYQRYPVLDATATLGRSSQGAGSSPSQSAYRNSQLQAGLRLSMPLYAGGLFRGRKQEALALFEKAEIELRAQQKQVAVRADKSLNQYRLAQKQLHQAAEADRAASWEHQLAVKGVAAGQKTQLDVQKAQRQKLEAEKMMNTACYGMLKSWFELQSLKQPINASLIEKLEGILAGNAAKG